MIHFSSKLGNPLKLQRFDLFYILTYKFLFFKLIKLKKIAVLGASYLQLPLVRKAKELELEVHCFSWEDGAVCKNESDFFYPISILEKEHIFEICKELKIDGVVSIASDAAVHTVSYIAGKLDLVSNSFEDSIVTTNKYLMRKRFSENDVLSPQYLVAKNQYSIDRLKFPLIVKPTDRSGSRGVKKVGSVNDLDAAVIRAKKESFTNQAIIEEYITGNEISVEVISWAGKHYVLAITDKVTTGSPYFIEIEHHQPSRINSEIQDKVIDTTIRALNSLNIKYGASHSEFKITDKGDVYVIEVGARMGGDFIGSTLVELSTGYDFLKGVIDVSLDQFNAPLDQGSNYAGVFFLCEETKHLLQLIQNKSKYPEIVEAELFDKDIKIAKCSADRTGYLIYQSQNPFKI